MATIIAVENTKGGVGKSTIVSNLARGLQLHGSKVLIVDRDRLRVIRMWREKSLNNDYPFVAGIETATIHTKFDQIKDGFDFIIIDGSAVVEEMAISAIKAADIVLIPIQPSGADIWGCTPLLEIIKTHIQVNKSNLIARFIINREKKNTITAREFSAELDKFGLPTLNCRISESVKYAECFTRGSTVFDSLKTAGRLAAEQTRLIDEVMGLIL